MTKALGWAIILILVANSQLFAADWKSDVEASYDKKTFLIRGFYEGKTLHYDGSGNLSGNGTAGSWTTSFFNVEEFKWKEHVIEVKGTRLAEMFDRKRQALYTVKTGDSVTLKIESLDEIDEAAIRRLLTKILIGPQESLVEQVPDYWKYFIEHTDTNGVYTPEPPDKSKKECVQVDDTRMVCNVGGMVKPPRALQAPDPSYDDLAHKNNIQGTSVLWLVVDTSGMPTKIRIDSPLGFGLDDCAVAAVKKWKFAPAIRDGEPVAVQIRVEVNFRLY